MQREGFVAYQGYLDGHEEEIAKGEPFVLEVRDLQTMTRMVVRARVARSQQELPQGKPLYRKGYRDEFGFEGEPWAIEILEELDEDIVPQRADTLKGSGDLYTRL